MPYWYQRPGYVKAMAKLVLHEVQNFTDKELEEGIDVLFRYNRVSGMEG